MATKTLTNQELVDLANGLHMVKDLKGVKFALVVAKNTALLQKELKQIDEASKPSDEFMEIARQIQELTKEGKEEEAKKLEKENESLQEDRKKQIERGKAGGHAIKGRVPKNKNLIRIHEFYSTKSKPLGRSKWVTYDELFKIYHGILPDPFD